MSSSMTGFGRGEAVLENRRIIVEIKTINNRYGDVQIRMPRILASLENRVREQVSRRIARGKVDLTVGYDDTSSQSCRVVCNVGLAKAGINCGILSYQSSGSEAGDTWRKSGCSDA